MSLLAYGLAWAGVTVAVFGAIRLCLTGQVFTRLHFVGPLTVLAAPLILAGLALAPGLWSSFHDVFKLGLIGVLLVLTGPASVVATARAAHGPAGEGRGDG